MNPYLIIGAGIFWVLSVGGAYIKGQTAGADRVIAKQVAVNDAVRETREAAQQGAAAAIAKIEVKNVTINRKLETEVREKPVFRDCRSGADSVRLYNSGIPGYVEPSPDGKLPPKDTASK